MVCNLENCSRSFYYFSSLKTHIKTKHSEEYDKLYGSNCLESIKSEKKEEKVDEKSLPKTPQLITSIRKKSDPKPLPEFMTPI